MADDIVDPARRLELLVNQQSPIFASKFMILIEQIKEALDLQAIADLIERGNLEAALTEALRRAPALGNLYLSSYVAAAEETAAFLNRKLSGITIDFDQTNPLVVAHARENKLRLVREFSRSQADATRQAILNGIKEGANPRQQARNFRDSIGLTQKQVQAVEKYRQLLNDGDKAVFDRALRDKRFDPTIRRAILDEKPLTRAQVNTMVDRYRQRFVQYRSEVIGRTEALRSVHAGNHGTYLQAIENGDLDPNNLMNEWNTKVDERRRPSHAAMHNQKQPFGTPFVSGDGHTTLYPGGFNVASEDIQCRCAVGTRIIRVDVPAGTTFQILQ